MFFIQAIHNEQTKIKETFLILQYSTLKHTVHTVCCMYNIQTYSTLAGIQGLAACQQARRAADWRREWRWEMAELKGH